jgi:hypothetical protein
MPASFIIAQRASRHPSPRSRGQAVRPLRCRRRCLADLLEPATSLHDAIGNLVRRAEHRDRRIVAWSEHELDVVRGRCADDPDLVARFEARFANARAVAERWRNKRHDGDKPDPGRLVDYLGLIGYPLPLERWAAASARRSG